MLKKQIVPRTSPEAKQLVCSLAIQMLDLAIECGATYFEIRKACEQVLDLMEKDTSPRFIAVGEGLREIGTR